MNTNKKISLALLVVIALALLANLYYEVRGGEVKGEITTEQIFEEVNQVRLEAGLAPLAHDSLLDVSADLRLDDMTEHEYFSHESPVNHYHSWDWIRVSGYSYGIAGENLARRYDSAEETVEAWVASPTHLANILNPEYTETGIAIEGDVIVQHFASPL